VFYNKGAAFMDYLESLVGWEVMKGFLRAWCRTYQFRSADSTNFKDLFMSYTKTQNVTAEILGGIDWSSWLYSTGRPTVVRDMPNVELIAAKTILEDVLNNRVNINALGMTTEWPRRRMMYFMFEMERREVEVLESAGASDIALAEAKDLFAHMLSTMNETYNMRRQGYAAYSIWLKMTLTASSNSTGVPAVIPAIEELLSQFRGKRVLRYMYRSLKEINPSLAKTLYLKYRSRYPPVTSALCGLEVGITDPGSLTTSLFKADT